MIITVDGKLYTQGCHTLNEVNAAWIDITKQLFEREHFIYNVNIDGAEFFDSYEEVILNNYTAIDQVEINTLGYSEALSNTLHEMKKYAVKLMDHLDAVASPFYGNVKEEDWQLFNQFSEGVGWLNQSCQFCLEIAGRKAGTVDVQVNQMLNHLKTETEEALALYLNYLNEQEYNQLADAILYEFAPIVEQLLELELEGE